MIISNIDFNVALLNSICIDMEMLTCSIANCFLFSTTEIKLELSLKEFW